MILLSPVRPGPPEDSECLFPLFPRMSSNLYRFDGNLQAWNNKHRRNQIRGQCVITLRRMRAETNFSFTARGSWWYWNKLIDGSRNEIRNPPLKLFRWPMSDWEKQMRGDRLKCKSWEEAPNANLGSYKCLKAYLWNFECISIVLELVKLFDDSFNWYRNHLLHSLAAEETGGGLLGRMSVVYRTVCEPILLCSNGLFLVYLWSGCRLWCEFFNWLGSEVLCPEFFQ